jgi:hypothetical protein
MPKSDCYYVSMWNTQAHDGPGMFPHHVQGWGKATQLREELNAKLSQEDRQRGAHWDIQNSPPCSQPVKKRKRRSTDRQNPLDRRNRRS